MKVKKVINQGNPRCQVDIPKTSGGQRRRKFFATREAAEEFARARGEGLRRMGSEWALHFDSRTIHDKANLISVRNELASLGCSIRDTFELVKRAGRFGPFATLSPENLCPSCGCDSWLTHMKTATVRELRGEFPRLLRWLQAGETVAISRKGNVVARLVPPETVPAADFVLPDFAAQRREVFGTKPAGEPLPRSIVAEERESYDR